MRSPPIAMTLEEFERLPRRLGWKHEYWDGQAHITPSYHFVNASMDVQSHPYGRPCPLRPVHPDDEAMLIASFYAAFEDAFDYCDWEPERIRDSGVDMIQGFLAGKRGEPLPASRVAVTVSNGVESLVGTALLVRQTDTEARLDLLFVVSEWRRRGLATALVAEAMAELNQAGFRQMASGYRLGNEASRAWHGKFGFREEPDWFLAEHFLRHAQFELWRRERIGELTPAERSDLLAEIERWSVLANELESAWRQSIGLDS